MDNLKIVLICVLILESVFIYKSCKEQDNLISERAQLEAHYNDSLKVLRKDNLELYNRVADLQDLNSNKNEIIKEKDETIVSQSNTIVHLNNIISHGVGTVDTVTIIQNNCIGIKLHYKDSNAFFNLKVDVEVNDPPIFDINQVFNPFGLITHISRDKQGIYSGYLEVTPDSIKPFLKIKEFNVVMDRDEFLDHQPHIINLQFAPSVSLGFNKDLKGLIFFGGQALIRETHLIGYEKGINNDYHLIRYSYFISFLSF